MITENWSNLELDAWIAGVLDGDGHKGHGSNICEMNDREALETIHLRIGNEITKSHNTGDNTRENGTGATYRKNMFLLRFGSKGEEEIPQSIAYNMYEPDARRRYYKGSARLRDMHEPPLQWFAGYFVAEGNVDIKHNYMQVKIKDKIMLEYWINRYGGHITECKPGCNSPNTLWLWYNHTHMTPTIIQELLPYMTNDKGSKMRELWNHYVGKIQ